MMEKHNLHGEICMEKHMKTLQSQECAWETCILQNYAWHRHKILDHVTLVVKREIWSCLTHNYSRRLAKSQENLVASTEIKFELDFRIFSKSLISFSISSIALFALQIFASSGQEILSLYVEIDVFAALLVWLPYAKMYKSCTLYVYTTRSTQTCVLRIENIYFILDLKFVTPHSFHRSMHN